MPKLPNIIDREGKREFAQELLALLCEDKRTQMYVTGEKDQYPSDKLDELLAENADRSPEKNTAAANLLSLMGNTKQVVDILKDIATTGNTDRWGELEAGLENIEKKSGSVPSQAIADYADAFGAECFGDPMVQFCFAMTQGLSNVFDRVVSERDVKQQMDLSNSIQKQYIEGFAEVDSLEDEFVSLCAENDVDPGTISAELKRVKNVITNNRDVPFEDLDKKPQDERNIELSFKSEMNMIGQDRKLYAPETLRALKEKSNKVVELSQEYNRKQVEYSQKYMGVEEDLEEKQKAVEEQKAVQKQSHEGPNKEAIDTYLKKQNTYVDLDDALTKLIDICEWEHENFNGRREISDSLKVAKKYGYGENFDKLKTDYFSEEEIQRLKDYCKSRHDALEAIDKLTAAGVFEEGKKSEIENIFKAVEAGETSMAELVNEENPLYRLTNQAAGAVEEEEKKPELQEFLEADNELARRKEELSVTEEIDEERQNALEELEDKEKEIDKLGNEYSEFAKNVAWRLSIPQEKQEGMLLAPVACDQFLETVKEYQTNKAAKEKLKDLDAREDLYIKDRKMRLDKAKHTKFLQQNPEYRLKKGEKLETYETKLNMLEELDGKRQTLEKKNTGKFNLLDDEVLCTRAKGELARNEKFRNSIGMFQRLLKPGDRSDNSKYYNDMIDAMSAAKEAFSGNSRQDNNLTHGQAMENLFKAAKAYVDAKESQFRPFPSVRRNTRLQSAKSLLAFAENADKQMKAEGEMERGVFRSVMERDKAGKPEPSTELAKNVRQKLTAVKNAPQRSGSVAQRSNEREPINMAIPNNGH